MVASGRQSAKRACGDTGPNNPSEERTAVCIKSMGLQGVLGDTFGSRERGHWLHCCCTPTCSA
eukprot:2540064-Lingulodinium_polyedra.AAC.1